MEKKTAHLHENTGKAAIRRHQQTRSRCPAVLVFSLPMLTCYIFLSFWLLCFSPLTSSFIYLLFFGIACPGIIVLRIERYELLCNYLVLFPSSAHCHQCQCTHDDKSAIACLSSWAREGGCLVVFLQSKTDTFSKSYFCGYKYLFFFLMSEHKNPELHNDLTNIIPPQFKNPLSFKITVTERPCIFH